MESNSAAPRARARLLPPWALLGFTLLVVSALALLFLRRELAELVLRSSAHDGLTETYLGQLHSLEPGNARLALRLARLHLVRGRAHEALALAEPHLRAPEPALAHEARHVRRDALVALAAQAADSGELGLARLLYRRILLHERDADWMEEAAERFVGWGDYRFAAELYFNARRHARTPDAARTLYRAGVHALLAGNLPAEALAAAERELGALAEDDAVLLELVQLARAADRTDLAAGYMKRLMRMKPRASLGERLLDVLVPPAHAASALPRLRAYDAALYAMAYEIFLANRDLNSAFFVAQAAVGYVPDDVTWRERLARVSEQSGRAAQALAAWRWVAERTGDEQAWQAVLRLAPGLNDDDAAAAALRHRVQSPQASAADAHALADAYERLGQPAEGLAWFEGLYRRTGLLTALALAADLAEESGRAEQAIALNLELAAVAEPPPDRLLRVATLQILGGRLADAHALLWRFRGGSAARSGHYWSLLADLAWTLQDDASAIYALTQLTERLEADPTDFDRLTSLLRPRQPAQAASVARAGFERFGTPALWLHAAGILAEVNDTGALRRLYDELEPEHEALFAREPFFYSLRSKLAQRRGDLAGARRDLERAVAIAPDDAQQRLALVWLLIEAGDHGALRAALTEESARAEERAWWPAFAAGWGVLREPRSAMPFLARLAQSTPDDFFWLAIYADALEQEGRMNAADRVRRHAWAAAHSDNAAAGSSADAERRLRYAKLVVRQAPGDPALQVLRKLQAEDASPAAEQLARAWSLSVETPEPVEAPPVNDANQVGAGAGRLRTGALDTRPRQVSASGTPAPRLRVELAASDAEQSSLDEGVLRGVPAHDRALRLSGRHTVDRRWIEVALGAREAFADSVGVAARWYQGWSQRLATLGAAAWHEPTTDSTALAVAGMRDFLGLRGSYALSKTEQLGAHFWGAGYRTQSGVRLGSAYGYEADIAHRVRLEYPDIALRLFGAGHRSRTQGSGDPATAPLSPDGSVPGPGFFVPASARRYGIDLALGESAREVWTRALRVYGGIALIHNSVSGDGYLARLGARTALLGTDQLRVYWSRAEGAGVSAERTLAYGIEYEYRFERR